MTRRKTRHLFIPVFHPHAETDILLCQHHGSELYGLLSKDGDSLEGMLVLREVNRQ